MWETNMEKRNTMEIAWKVTMKEINGKKLKKIILKENITEEEKIYAEFSIIYIVNPMIYICIPWCYKYTQSQISCNYV